MAEDEQNNNDGQPQQNEPAEYNNAIEPEAIGELVELMGSHWRIHIDERIRRIYEPMGAIPKRCVILQSPESLARAELARKMRSLPQVRDKTAEVKRKKQKEDLRRVVLLKSMRTSNNQSPERPIQRLSLHRDTPAQIGASRKSLRHQAMDESDDAGPSKRRRMNSSLESPVNSPVASTSMMLRDERHRLPSLDSNQRRLNASAEDRQAAVYYLVLVATHSDLSYHIMYQTVRIFDDVLRVRAVTPNNFRLLMLSALYIILEQHAVDDLTRVNQGRRMFSRQTFSDEEIASGKRGITRALNSEFEYSDPFFHLDICISSFNNAGLMTARQKKSIYDFANYMLETALFDGTLMKAPPILLAAAVAELATALIMEPETTLASTPFQRWRSTYVSEYLWSEDVNHHRILLMTSIIEPYYHCFKSHLIYEKYALAHFRKAARKLLRRLDKLLLPPNPSFRRS